MRKHISLSKVVKRRSQTNCIIHKNNYGSKKYNAKKLFYILIRAFSLGSEDLNPGFYKNI